ALNASVTLPTTADVDVKLAVDWLSWDLDLILLIDLGLFDRSTTIGAGTREERLVDLVDLLRRRSMCLRAVLLAGVAPRPLGVGLGWPVCERGCLTLAGALLLFEQASEALDLRFQIGDAALQLLATGTCGLVHAGKIPKNPTRSCASERVTLACRRT